MRLIKMLGLAAIAALAAMALVGAGTASASSTLLCTTDNAACNPPASLDFKSAKAVTTLLNGTMDVSCIALFQSTSVGALGTPQVIKGNFTYSSCTFPCTVSEKNGPATINVLKTGPGSDLATVTGEGLVNVNCLGIINCNYIGKNLSGHGLGGLEIAGGEEAKNTDVGHVTFVKTPVEFESGSNCPETATLDALFISSGNLYIKA